MRGRWQGLGRGGSCAQTCALPPVRCSPHQSLSLPPSSSRTDACSSCTPARSSQGPGPSL